MARQRNRGEANVLLIENSFALAGNIFRYLFYFGVLWIGKEIIFGFLDYPPERLESLANLLSRLDISKFLWGGWGVIPTVGWYVSHRAKKAQNKRFGDYRKQIEAADPGGRMSSELTEYGETPGDKE